MTQIEQILLELERAGDRGLLSMELREKTGINAGTMRSTLYELNKKEWVRKTGSRGSYRYAITQKGRTELYHRQPLAKQGAELMRPELAKHEEDYENFLKLMDRADEFRLLRQFSSFLTFESEIDFGIEQKQLKRELDAEVLRFMGIDPHSVDDTLAKLDTLVSAVRGTV